MLQQPQARMAEFRTSWSTNPMEDYWPKVTMPSRGAAQKAGDNSGYYEVAVSDAIVSPPGLLGFSALITPDEKFGPKFNLNLHWTEAQAKAFSDQIGKLGTDAFPKLAAKVAADNVAASKKLKEFASDPWLEDKLKQPAEKNRIQLPYCHFSTNASYKNKAGETVPVSVRAWSDKNAPLDLQSLCMGMGSTIQAVYKFKLYTNGLLKGRCEPSLKLFGVRVLKLERFTQSVQLPEVSDGELVGLEDGFEADDLAQYAMGSKTVQATQRTEEGAELDEEVPF